MACRSRKAEVAKFESSLAKIEVQLDAVELELAEVNPRLRQVELDLKAHSEAKAAMLPGIMLMQNSCHTHTALVAFAMHYHIGTCTSAFGGDHLLLALRESTHCHTWTPAVDPESMGGLIL